MAAVFGLLLLAGSTELLSNVTRPVVVGLLHLMRVSASDTAAELVLGRLRVPWTRDCAGVNILTMLWAITLWANRAESLSGRYWLRLVLVVPAALLANIARIFTLLAYRYGFYPAVETSQLHYFIGFLWIMPCLPFFVPRAGREAGRYMLETLFLVTALSLVSPFVQAPGGNLVTLATLLLLAQSRYKPLSSDNRPAAAVWGLAAGLIAAASMESLWLPWLMLCPWFGRQNLLRSPSRLLLLLGTIPLVAMHPLARWCVAGAAAFELWRLIQSNPDAPEPGATAAPSAPWLNLCSRSGLALLLVLPFVASSATGFLRSSLRPPRGAMSKVVEVNTYEVRLIGQPHDLQLIWYGPSGDGRHHTLAVCMRYRGIELKPSRIEPSVMTDGKIWTREFFLQRGTLLTDYRAYLRNTLLPWSPAGVHIIASAPVDGLSSKAFAEAAFEFTRQLNQLDASQTQAQGARQNQ